MAVTQSGADYKRARGSLDYVVGDRFEFVDLEDSCDLRKEAFEQPEVSAGDPLDRGDRLRVGEVLGIEGAAETLPVTREDEEKLVTSQVSVSVGKPEPAVELRVVAETLVDAGHANEDDRDVFSIMSVTKNLEGGRGESLGFIDDEELYPSPRIMSHDGACHFADRAKMFIDAVPQSPLDAVDVAQELGGFCENGRGEEQGAGSMSRRVVFRIGRIARAPLGDERFESVPLGVTAS